MPSFHIREDLLNLLNDSFFQYYRRHRNNRYKELTTSQKVNSTVQKLFAEMHIMMEECNHGFVLKNFGVVAPKEFLKEEKTRFKVVYKKSSHIQVFLEDEYLNSQYKTILIRKNLKRDKKVDKIKKPRPHAILLHRKKLRKNKLKNGEN